MTLNAAIPNFGTTSATLNYDDRDQLTGTRSLEGHIGRVDFETDLSNAPRIQGDLDMPIDQYISVSGNGMWTQSY
jgi:hypothetical protein